MELVDEIVQPDRVTTQPKPTKNLYNIFQQHFLAPVMNASLGMAAPILCLLRRLLDFVSMVEMDPTPPVFPGPPAELIFKREDTEAGFIDRVSFPKHFRQSELDSLLLQLVQYLANKIGFLQAATAVPLAIAATADHRDGYLLYIVLRPFHVCLPEPYHSLFRVLDAGILSLESQIDTVINTFNPGHLEQAREIARTIERKIGTKTLPDLAMPVNSSQLPALLDQIFDVLHPLVDCAVLIVDEKDLGFLNRVADSEFNGRAGHPQAYEDIATIESELWLKLNTNSGEDYFGGVEVAGERYPASSGKGERLGAADCVLGGIKIVIEIWQ
jgi:hypothetical protein